jgi:uncharacterized protein (TIGR02646 family)
MENNMRPVERGTVPIDKNGNPKQYKEYGDARDDLVEQLGSYCSYCEIQLSSLAVEHIQPKKLYPILEKEWNNFLLACPSCNSIKKDKQINPENLHDYFWVDKDNTFYAFFYEKDRALQIAQYLNTEQQKIAQNTLELIGLDREPNHPKWSWKKPDKRWQPRLEAWGKAELAKQRLKQQQTDLFREQIIDTAISTGFFSVWMTVFQDDMDMRQCLITAFRGTSSVCFDINTRPIPRIGGHI